MIRHNDLLPALVIIATAIAMALMIIGFILYGLLVLVIATLIGVAHVLKRAIERAGPLDLTHRID